LAGIEAADIRIGLSERFGYDMNLSVSEWATGYEFDVTCQGTVPPALTCALEASSYEDAIRSAVSIGGDTDTICAICGSLSEAMFYLPDEIKKQALERLDDYLRDIVDRFFINAVKILKN